MKMNMSQIILKLRDNFKLNMMEFCLFLKINKNHILNFLLSNEEKLNETQNT